jgi:hypothetical protein
MTMLARLSPRLDGVSFDVQYRTIGVEVLGDVAVVTARGDASRSSPREERHGEYRVTGVLVRDGTEWRWRIFHGSEPAGW